MYTNKEVTLMNIAGEDRPGLTAALTRVLANHDALVLDIGQAVIHRRLSLGMLFLLPENGDSSLVVKELLFTAYEHGVSAKFTNIPAETYEKWVQEQGKDRFIVTLLAQKLAAEHVAAITHVLYEQKLNIDIINRLTGRVSLQEVTDRSQACVELSVRGTPKDLLQMKRDCMSLAKTLGIDIAFQHDNAFRRNRRLVCFDMDSTLIQVEVIVELARFAGVQKEVSEITEAAMRGELDFKESFKRRIKLLKGIDESALHEIARNLPLTAGAGRLIRNLKRFGYKTAILSGGFNYFGRYLQSVLGVDYVFANELEIIDGKLTGNHLGDIVDGNMKAELLRKLAFKEDLHLEQVIAVGDGANDLPMINIAGLGIAFNAKPIVQENAQHAISNLGLDSILYLLGFRDREID